MNCQEARELCSDYLDHRLAPAQVSSLEEHLKACSVCNQEIEALRATISLIGSLDKISTSPDFLDQVQKKIKKRRDLKRVTWLFHPLRNKVPLEIAASVLLSIGALYLYYRSPELTKEVGGHSSLENFEVAQNRHQQEFFERRTGVEKDNQTTERAPMGAAKPEVHSPIPGPLDQSKEASQKLTEPARSPSSREDSVASLRPGLRVLGNKVKENILDRKGSNQESDQVAAQQAEKQVQVEAKSVQPSPSQPAEPMKESRDESALSASKSQVYEVLVDDVDHYQASVKTLLEKLSGKLLTQEGASGSGLLLVVELPQSRQSEFFAALKEAEGTRSLQSTLGQGAVGTTSGEFQRTHDPIAEKKAPDQNSARASVSSLQKDEPTVTIQLRVLPKH